jgi:hypothetical protein
MVPTSSTGTKYSAAAAGGTEIVNAGEKTLEVMDEQGNMKFMKIQMCEGLCDTKFLASVSRITQAGHKVVFDNESGSYLEDKTTGKKIWLRQENGVYYLDLWIRNAPTFQGQGSKF